MLTALADGRLLAERIGATPPAVVALHGWQRSGGDFVGLLAGLDAVAPNLPGFGATEEPPTVWGTEDYAELVAEAIAPFAPLVVVGHSFGGRVAVRLAARHPELVSGLVLTGVPLVRLGTPTKPRLSFRIVRSLTKAHLLPQSVLENQRRKHGSRDYNAASGIMRGIMVRAVNEDYSDDLSALDLPVRMVWGEFDTEAPTAAGEAASGMIRGATFRVVHGQAHLLEGSLATAVREELDTLLTEVSS
jgi:pimeloyl-ACP methyl ester carboxylesterase